MWVAVCTDARSSRVAEVVAALERADCSARVFASPDGLAQARNAALLACEADVIAFVDDDVVVGEGWGTVLREAWEAAPADVAAIGGPIAVEFPRRRPAGVARPHVGGLDLGAEARAIAPATESLMAGNLSFRAEALR